MKGFEMGRSSWIIPQYIRKCLYKSEAEGDVTHRGEGD